MDKSEIKIGQDVTIVSRGIRHHTYGEGTYIDESAIGRASFLTVTRIGREYLYGKHFYIDDDRKRKTCDWEDKVKLDENLVFAGMRQDIKELHEKYRILTNEYDKLREDACREIERKYHELMRAEQDEWNKAHPTPAPVDLAKIQENISKVNCNGGESH